MIIGLVVLAYLIGAIPVSFLAARIGAGIDLRTKGSGNLGATNLYRQLGWKYAVPVAIADVAKGAIPVATFPTLVGGSATLNGLAFGAAAVIGHVFPVYLRFKGGKGVATAAGAVMAAAPAAFLVSFVAWASLLAALRIMSVASIASALVFPLAAWRMYPDNMAVAAVGGAIAVFIIFTHRANISRILAGQEPRLGRTPRGAATK